MKTHILGIDCAAQPENTGFALLSWSGRGKDRAKLVGLRQGRRREDAAVVAAELLGSRRPVLLAMDAPLGWPRELARSLAEHRAGEPLQAGAHVSSPLSETG